MKRKAIITLLVVLALVAGSILIRVIRLDDNTTYVPFSGRIFDFQVHEVSDLFLQNVTTGFQTTEADTEAVCAALNGLRSRFWFPNLKFFATGGWSYRAALIDGSVQKSFYFNNGPIPYISVNGIIYILSGEQADVLISFVE